MHIITRTTTPMHIDIFSILWEPDSLSNSIGEERGLFEGVGEFDAAGVFDATGGLEAVNVELLEPVLDFLADDVVAEPALGFLELWVAEPDFLDEEVVAELAPDLCEEVVAELAPDLCEEVVAELAPDLCEEVAELAPDLCEEVAELAPDLWEEVAELALDLCEEVAELALDLCEEVAELAPDLWEEVAELALDLWEEVWAEPELDLCEVAAAEEDFLEDAVEAVDSIHFFSKVNLYPVSHISHTEFGHFAQCSIEVHLSWSEKIIPSFRNNNKINNLLVDILFF